VIVINAPNVEMKEAIALLLAHSLPIICDRAVDEAL
jgi:hypothetical protein